MPETTPLIKAALNLRVGAGFDVYESMLPNNGFFYFRFGSIVLSLIRIIGTVQLYNTFFYTCHYYNRNSKMYGGGVLCVKKKINMISGRLGLP